MCFVDGPFSSLQKWIARHAGATITPDAMRLKETPTELRELADDLHDLLINGDKSDFQALRGLYRRSSFVTDEDSEGFDLPTTRRDKSNRGRKEGITPGPARRATQ